MTGMMLARRGCLLKPHGVAGASQLFTDFSQYTTGEQPSDWSKQWQTTDTTWAVREKAGTTGGKCLEVTGTGNGWRALVWDLVGSVADVEVVMRVRSSSGGSVSGAGDRIVGIVRATSGPTAYMYRSTWGIGRASKILAGTATDLNGTLTATESSNAWHWRRIRVDGTTVQFRRWADGATEPETWNFLNGTDTDISDAGWVGFAASSVQTQDFDLLGVGLNGESAPLAAV